ncbi:MAG: aminoglycoside phosphotransferase family protein [Chloroflexota bacterium]|nr:MAG: aminoglycoside phosphotransferase family protein [Chloroflexota bacterium]
MTTDLPGTDALRTILGEHLVLDKKDRASARSSSMAKIAGLKCEPFNESTSFPAWLLTVQFDSGNSKKIYLKDFATSRLPKDDLPARRRREVRVYQELLDSAALDTAGYFGEIWDPEQERYWLLIEYLEAVELRSLGLEDWIKAAAWLGRLHGYYLPSANRLASYNYLMQHEATFFQSKATLARASMAYFKPECAGRLEAILRDYDRVIEVMVRQPRTLVHGSFRPQNILVQSPNRICPIDWELAAYGAPLYDLAFILDGFRPPKLQQMTGAYRQQATRNGVHVPEEEELLFIVNCFRLHKTIKSLGDSASFNFSEETVFKLLGMAEKVKDELFDGTITP